MLNMPIKECKLDGKPGWQWGESGTCYTYDPKSAGGSAVAKAKAAKQAAAAHSSGYKEKQQRIDGQVQI